MYQRLRVPRKRIALCLLALLSCFSVVGIAQAVGTTRAVPSAPTATRGVGTPEPHFPPALSGQPTSFALPADRQAFLNRRATEIAFAPKAPPVTKGPPLAISAAEVQRTPETGIRDVQISPFQSRDAIIANRWQGSVAGKFVVVYAGRLINPPDQGFIAVSSGTSGAPDFSLQRYPTPQRVGSVRITAENGALLTLTSDSGARFTFDVGKRTFVPLPT